MGALKYAAFGPRGNKSVVFEAVKQDPLALEFAPDDVQLANRELVVDAIKRSWEALKYASEEFRDDREIVLEAVKQEPSALRYASDCLRTDPMLMREAEQHGLQVIAGRCTRTPDCTCGWQLN